MPQDPRASLSALLRATEIEDHDEILKASNAALKANKNDDTAKLTKVVALLKLDRFEDALRVIADDGIKFQASCVLEKAYALYKTGQLDEAASVIKAVGLEKRSLRHVAAQVAYRAERFSEAEAIYSKFLDVDPSNEENDLKINNMAAVAQSKWHSFAYSTPTAQQGQLEAFELCFNLACSEIARGGFESAVSLLDRAIVLCNNSDELEDDERVAELRPIRAQLAYVYAKMGNRQAALEIYQSLGAKADSDGPDFAVIAQNNLLALEASSNPFLRQRKAASLTPAKPDSKLFSYQSNTLARNSILIDMEAYKIRGTKDRTQKILASERHPTMKSDINVISVINAAAEIHGSVGKEALRSLLALSSKRPNDVGLILTLVQFHLQQGHVGAALSKLESFLSRLERSDEIADRDVRFSPGLVALVVSLMRTQQRESLARTELVKAAQHWHDRPSGFAASLLQEIGVELMRSPNPEDLSLAGSAFQKLVEEQRNTDITSAGLVAAYAALNPLKTRQCVESLPPVEDLVWGLDVGELVAAGVAAAPSGVASRKRLAADDASGRAMKKRRRRKLPKNYVEGKVPDPERWLPLRDRSSYRPKGKKGKKKASEATQGGIVRNEETLELVGGGGVKVEKAPSTNASKKKKKAKK